MSVELVALACLAAPKVLLFRASFEAQRCVLRSGMNER